MPVLNYPSLSLPRLKTHDNTVLLQMISDWLPSVSCPLLRLLCLPSIFFLHISISHSEVHYLGWEKNTFRFVVVTMSTSLSNWVWIVIYWVDFFSFSFFCLSFRAPSLCSSYLSNIIPIWSKLTCFESHFVWQDISQHLIMKRGMSLFTHFSNLSIRLNLD